MRVFVLGLTLLFAGCTAWRPIPRASTGKGAQGAETVRLTLPDGRQLFVHHAEAVGDSLIGDADGERVAFALADIRRVDIQRNDPGRTQTAAGVAGGTVAGIVFAAGFIALTAAAVSAVLELFVTG